MWGSADLGQVGDSRSTCLEHLASREAVACCASDPVDVGVVGVPSARVTLTRAATVLPVDVGEAYQRPQKQLGRRMTGHRRPLCLTSSGASRFRGVSRRASGVPVPPMR